MSRKKPLENPFEDNEMFPYDKEVFEERYGKNAMLHAGLGMADLGMPEQMDCMLETKEDVEEWLMRHRRYLVFVTCASVGFIDVEHGGYTDWEGGYVMMSLPVGEKPNLDEENEG